MRKTGGKFCPAQTKAGQAQGSLGKGLWKSECLSLPGLFASFVELPSFPGPCLLTFANDDKLLPQDPQPFFHTAYGLIAITFQQQAAIREGEYVV